MKKIVSMITLLLVAAMAFAQGTVKGVAVEKATGEAMSFVNVVLTKPGQTKIVKGGLTDTEGAFDIGGIPVGKYQVTLSFVGYKSVTKDVTIERGHLTADLGRILMLDDAHQLGEVTVTGQRSAIKLEVDRKTYDVASDLSNVGASASEALENIPSVEVDQDGNISLRGSSSVEVWINGKASGLNSDNRGTILQQIPAESIERIEVIDNPSSKFSAEGSSGIINIILKRDRKAGYYGSLQAGGNTAGGANTSANINVNSGLLDAYASIGYRHFADESGSISEQDIYKDGILSSYQNSEGTSTMRGNNIFTRAGITLHATKKDDFSLSGMFMKGRGHNNSDTPYYYGDYINGSKSAAKPTHVLARNTTGTNDMKMQHYEAGYRHQFTDRHFLDLTVSHSRWGMDADNYYRDRTEYASNTSTPSPNTQSWQYRPLDVNNKNTEIKLDYENPISDRFMLQAGYNARFGRELTPQEAWSSDDYDGAHAVVDTAYYNNFRYDIDTHALYATATLKFGKLGVMAGLRGEYWKVFTESLDFYQQYMGAPVGTPYKKDFLKLFPSLFVTYQLTDRDQLQVNVTRRLRRPWGGEMNSFIDTRSATSVSFGNPELTPEYSSSYQLNYLRTWDNHSFLLSAYYRPTTDVIQRIRYMIDGDNRTFSTNMNLSQSTNSGFELTMKNKLFRILDLTTTASAFYYKLDGFDYELIDPLMGQKVHVTGESDSRFSWNARIQASVILPYDFSVQVKGNYRSRQVITQGERKPGYGIDLGIRKSFMDKKLTVALNCRDLLDSRRWKTETSSDTFHQYSENWRHSRKLNLNVTWTFGNNNKKKLPMGEDGRPEEEDTNTNSSYSTDGGFE